MLATPPTEDHCNPHFVAGICICGCEYCATDSGKCICLQCPDCAQRVVTDAAAALNDVLHILASIVAFFPAPECEWCGETYNGQPLCRHPTLN